MDISKEELKKDLINLGGIELINIVKEYSLDWTLRCFLPERFNLSDEFIKKYYISTIKNEINNSNDYFNKIIENQELNNDTLLVFIDIINNIKDHLKKSILYSTLIGFQKLDWNIINYLLKNINLEKDNFISNLLFSQNLNSEKIEELIDYLPYYKNKSNLTKLDWEGILRSDNIDLKWVEKNIKYIYKYNDLIKQIIEKPFIKFEEKEYLKELYKYIPSSQEDLPELNSEWFSNSWKELLQNKLKCNKNYIIGNISTNSLGKLFIGEDINGFTSNVLLPNRYSRLKSISDLKNLNYIPIISKNLIDINRTYVKLKLPYSFVNNYKALFNIDDLCWNTARISISRGKTHFIFSNIQKILFKFKIN